MTTKNAMIIKNSLENVQVSCEKRLQELYPAGVSQNVMERFYNELTYLQELGPELPRQLELFYLLEEAARGNGEICTSLKKDSGCLITYLLHGSLANPMPAHYCCTGCGYYKEENEYRYGIDLPEKICPRCGKTLRRDGFSLFAEMAWAHKGRKTLKLEGQITESFLPYAEKLLSELFPEINVVPMGMWKSEESTGKISVTQGGFYLLPKGYTMADYPELQKTLPDGRSCLSEEWWRMRYKANKEPDRIDLAPHRLLDALAHMQRTTGVYFDDITVEDISDVTWDELIRLKEMTQVEKELLRTYKPEKFQDISRLIAGSQNTYQGMYGVEVESYIEALIEIYNSLEFEKYPIFTREELWEILQELGVESAEALQFVNQSRRGKINLLRYRRSYQQYFKILDSLPELLQKQILQTRYLTSRASAVQITVLYMKLAYYYRVYKKKETGRSFLE